MPLGMDPALGMGCVGSLAILVFSDAFLLVGNAVVNPHPFCPPSLHLLGSDRIVRMGVDHALAVCAHLGLGLAVPICTHMAHRHHII